MALEEGDELMSEMHMIIFEMKPLKAGFVAHCDVHCTYLLT